MGIVLLGAGILRGARVEDSWAHVQLLFFCRTLASGRAWRVRRPAAVGPRTRAVAVKPDLSGT
jgi:hypothetical protein